PDDVGKVLDLLLAHNIWRRGISVNLIAAENVMSPLAELVYLNDLMGRYAEGTIGKRYYRGTKYVDALEEALSKAFSEALGARYVDVRPVSGTVANLAAFHGLAPEGGAIASLPTRAGGHISHNQVGGPKALKFKILELPFDVDNFNIDIDKAKRVVEEGKPNVVVLGASLYLFPHPVREISEIAHSAGSYVLHDSAHVLGLIIGRRFPNPLTEGADVMTSSTHKTFPGPQGGLIASNLGDEANESIARGVFPVFTSNYHMHRYAATYVTLAEMREFGEQYADQIIRNARALAEALHSYGFNVVAEHLGFTRTHQVALDVSKQGGGEVASKLLEDANIITNKNMLPWDKSAVKPSGIRLGVQEVTRWGMREGDMQEIARFFKEVLIDGVEPKKVSEKVAEFRRQFLEVRYGYSVDRELGLKILESIGIYLA
ncbi:MAG: serine hydroxymethyltransferase, partial [Thermoproteus sp.]|nr:serine hydroxymethyltransferase [Thermoproteus sp.]